MSNVDCNASANMRELSAKKGANSQKLKIANIDVSLAVHYCDN